MVSGVPGVPDSHPPGFLEEEEGLSKNPTPALGSGREKKTLHSTTRKRINQAKRS